jgi:hypothetical protein
MASTMARGDTECGKRPVFFRDVNAGALRGTSDTPFAQWLGSVRHVALAHDSSTAIADASLKEGCCSLMPDGHIVRRPARPDSIH